MLRVINTILIISFLYIEVSPPAEKIRVNLTDEIWIKSWLRKVDLETFIGHEL